MDLNKDFSAKIRYYREQSGLTQTSLARQITLLLDETDCTSTMICRWEAGNPNLLSRKNRNKLIALINVLHKHGVFSNS